MSVQVRCIPCKKRPFRKIQRSSGCCPPGCIVCPTPICSPQARSRPAPCCTHPQPRREAQPCCPAPQPKRAPQPCCAPRPPCPPPPCCPTPKAGPPKIGPSPSVLVRCSICQGGFKYNGVGSLPCAAPLCCPPACSH